MCHPVFVVGIVCFFVFFICGIIVFSVSWIRE